MNALVRAHDGMRNAGTLLGLTSIVLFLLGAIWVAYQMYFDDSPPFTLGSVYTMDVNGNRTSVFHPGEIMLVHRDNLCFLRTTPVQYGRRLVSVDEPLINIFINSESTMIKKGCLNNANVIAIPPHTPTGRQYYFDVTLSYQNNAFQFGASKFPAPMIEVR